jgi:hypothetical protein
MSRLACCHACGRHVCTAVTGAYQARVLAQTVRQDATAYQWKIVLLVAQDQDIRCIPLTAASRLRVASCTNMYIREKYAV